MERWTPSPRRRFQGGHLPLEGVAQGVAREDPDQPPGRSMAGRPGWQHSHGKFPWGIPIGNSSEGADVSCVTTIISTSITFYNYDSMMLFSSILQRFK